MKVMVTGAAGFIGSHSVEALLAQGHAVVALDNLRTGKLSNLQGVPAGAPFRFEQLDILTESERLHGLVQELRPDAILHLAALVNVQQCMADPGMGFRLNVEAVQRMAEVARNCAVKRLVFASSAAVYGDVERLPIKEDASPCPLGPYGAAKLASEALLQGYARAFGIDVVCLRYFNVYGPRQDASSPYSGVICAFDAKFRGHGRPTIHGDGEQTRDFIAVQDVARANVLALGAVTKGWYALNICTGRETSVRDLVSVFSRAHGRETTAEIAPARPGEIKKSAGDPRRAEDAISFRSVITVEQGIGELCRNFPA